jgi:hypothetical protein
MALDTTIGGAAADSYATIIEADAYHVKFNNTTWATLDTASKEAALRVGVRYVDGYQFTGEVATPTQSLQWPRIDATRNGYVLPYDSIPQGIKDAQCEAALRQSQGLMLTDLSAGSVTEETVGPITVKYANGTNDGVTSFPMIDSLLKPFFAEGIGAYQHRLVRT